MHGAHGNLTILRNILFTEVDALWSDMRFVLAVLETDNDLSMAHMDYRFRLHRNLTIAAFVFVYIPLLVLLHVSNFEKGYKRRLCELAKLA